MSTPGWGSCLDTFAEHLQQQRALVCAGQADLITEFVPEPGLGALPATLVPRARALQSEADALAEMIAEQLSRTRAAIARLHRPTQPARPSYVDSHC